MKKVSEVHFERMNMIAKNFFSKSENDELYLLKHEASKKINQMIDEIEIATQFDFNKIQELIKNVDDKGLHGGVDWYDYKLHLGSLLKENGFFLKS